MIPLGLKEECNIRPIYVICMGNRGLDGHVKIHDRSGDNYKITVTFDKGKGSLIKGIYSKKGNFIKWGGHSPGVFISKWTIVIPGEATNSNFHVKEKN